MKEEIPGRIEMVVGPMFSGKSEWLVGMMRKMSIAYPDKLLAVRYTKDNRYGTKSIVSHNKTEFFASNAENVDDVKSLVDGFENIRVLGMDEIQFYDPQLVDYLLELRLKGVNIYTTGLDVDFTGKPWETTMLLMAFADSVEKRTAICTVCYTETATRTQRLENGLPVSRKSQRVLIGGLEEYTARCIIHHEVPD